MKKPVFRLIKLLVILYCLIGIGCYYAQDWLLLHGKPVSRETKYQFDRPFTEVNINYDGETNINIVQFPSFIQSSSTDTVPKGLVLYFHGNREGVSHYAQYAKDFTDRGYEVWMIDYPGFGKSTGKFTEANVYEFALQEYKLARKHFAPKDIIIYGKSLGTGIAAQLADIRDCRRLILESPYYSMPALWSSWAPIYPWGSILHFKFPTWEHLPKVTAPITLFHGDHDRIIPHRQSTRLLKICKPTDQLITIPNAGHNDLPASRIYQQTLDTLLNH